jgi:hypothetical protein
MEVNVHEYKNINSAFLIAQCHFRGYRLVLQKDAPETNCRTFIRRRWGATLQNRFPCDKTFQPTDPGGGFPPVHWTVLKVWVTVVKQAMLLTFCDWSVKRSMMILLWLCADLQKLHDPVQSTNSQNTRAQPFFRRIEIFIPKTQKHFCMCSFIFYVIHWSSLSSHRLTAVHQIAVTNRSYCSFSSLNIRHKEKLFK